MNLTGTGLLFTCVTPHELGSLPQVQWIGTGEGPKPLPQARVLVIIGEVQDSSVMMYRFASDGAFAGDTWHENAEDAKRQALVEYDGYLGEWDNFPPEIADIFDHDYLHLRDYALKVLRAASDGHSKL